MVTIHEYLTELTYICHMFKNIKNLHLFIFSPFFIFVLCSSIFLINNLKLKKISKKKHICFVELFFGLIP